MWSIKDERIHESECIVWLKFSFVSKFTCDEYAKLHGIQLLAKFGLVYESVHHAVEYLKRILSQHYIAIKVGKFNG